MIQMFAAINPTPAPAPAPCADIKPRPAAAETSTDASARGCFHDVLRAAEADSRSTSDAVDSDRPSEPVAERAAAPVQAPAREDAPKADPCEDPAVAEAELVAALTAAAAGETTAAVEPVFASPPAAEPTQVDAEATGETLLDLIGRLKAALEEADTGRDGAARVTQLLQQIDLQAAKLPAEALPGRIHQALRDLRAHLSGIAWGKAVTAAAASSEPAAPGEPAPAVDIVRADTLGGDTAGAVTSARPDTPVAAAPAATSPGFEHARPLSRPLADLRTPSERPTAPAAADAEMTVEHPAHARFTPVHPADASRSNGPAASGLPATAEPVSAPEDRPADASADARAPRDPLSAMKTAAVETLATGENDPGVGPDSLPADGRGLRLHEPRADRPADSASVVRDREPAGVTRAGVFDQIVQRAALQVRTDQSEIKIDLKPDFLGNVRMQIVAEQQQVSVRILTDTPVVRDMIETGLQQLRSDLQSHGLQVDRIEVSVSDGYRDPRQRQGRGGEAAGGEREEVDAAARTGAAECSEWMAYRPAGSARRSNIDMFV